MVFSAPLMTTTTTGTIPHQAEEPTTPTVIVDPLPSPYFRALHEKATNKHDVGTYTVTNASFIGLAGFVAGLQEAFYTFEKMPPDVTRRTFLQAWRLGGIIGRKTLLGTAIGATFCYTEATLENARHTHDSWNGMAGGAAAGAVFAMLPYKPWPQPVAWPLFFAAAAWTADLVSEKIPFAMKGYKTYGAVPGRENWNDPEPPRPPILETGSATKPYLRNFWRGE